MAVVLEHCSTIYVDLPGKVKVVSPNDLYQKRNDEVIQLAEVVSDV